MRLGFNGNWSRQADIRWPGHQLLEFVHGLIAPVEEEHALFQPKAGPRRSKGSVKAPGLRRHS
jgi:hypothetical protein